MIIKGIIKTGEYYDSVSLMLIAKELNSFDGIADSGVVMGTVENKSILVSGGLFPQEFENAGDADLLIAIKAENNDAYEKAIAKLDDLFKKLRNKSSESSDFVPKSLEGALGQIPDANLSLISVAGKYAASEARKALEKGLHVMLFSDNVSIDDELELKKIGKEKKLLVMGPDCGTAIINGVPLAFANVVSRGDIGIVAASGTGLQEVSCIIDKNNCGVSQAIGTGGRDVKKDIGGIMFLEAMNALENDPGTKVIVLVSKPPHPEVLDKITSLIKDFSKPVVAILIGGNSEQIEKNGAIAAKNLSEAGEIAAALSKKISVESVTEAIKNKNIEIEKLGIKLAGNSKGKYLRGLYSGGTLCDESQLILKPLIGNTYSNTPLSPEFQLKDLFKSEENTIIDLGDDDFTVGRPHPMIDFSLRKKRMIEEAQNKEVAVILLDIVLGFGSNLDPAGEIVPTIKEVLKINSSLNIICSITGTKNDPQGYNAVKKSLSDSGAIVMDSNADASLLAGTIIKNIK